MGKHEDTELLDRIGELLDTEPRDIVAVTHSVQALQNRINDVFGDLGLQLLTPTVEMLPHAGYEISLVFPGNLGRRSTDKLLGRLEDLAALQRAAAPNHQVHQNTSLED